MSSGSFMVQQTRAYDMIAAQTSEKMQEPKLVPPYHGL